MKILSHIVTTCVGLGMLMQSVPSFAEALISADKVYTYANQGNLKELKKIEDKLNLIDSDGNSAVCKAILNNDIKGYNTLKTAGANMKPECIKNISAQTYNDFMNTLKIKGISGGDVATDSTSGTFLGMGTLGWSITGVAVLGGIAAVAGGGGGGGGGSGGNPSVSHENLCGTTQCGSHSQCINNTCVCDDGYGKNSSGMCVIYNHKSTILKEANVNNEYLNYSHYDYSSVAGLKGDNAVNSTNGLGNIVIRNISDSTVVGITGYKTINALNSSGTIRITSFGGSFMPKGDVYGMNGGNSINAYSNVNLDNTYGYIILDGNSQNMYGINGGVNAKVDAGHAYGSISLNYSGTGSAYGIYNSSYNLLNTSSSQYHNAEAEISIINNNLGNSYGMYSPFDVYNIYNYDSTTRYTAQEARITLQNLNNGNITGIYGKNVEQKNIGDGTAIISLNNLQNGIATGIYGIKNGTVVNNGLISISRSTYCNGSNCYDPSSENGGTTYGIYTEEGTTITNSDSIQIKGAINGFGIYAKGNGGTITNSGIIDVSATNAYGIYVENGTNTTVINTGTIKLNGVECSSGDCSGATSNGNYIVLNGGTLLNNGVFSAQSLSTNSLKGTLTAGKNAQFDIQNNFDGNLNLSAELVSDGFKTTYLAEDMIHAGNTDGLNLVSKSALFDAKLADNGSDVIMKMKSFDSITRNDSLAQFLANNYALGNNEKFFSKLKAFSNLNSLTNSLDKMMGKDMLSRFNFEDMTMMRELNFDMNEHLFHNKEQQFSLAGTVSPMAFKGDTGSNSRYSLTSKRDGAWSVGLGIAFTDVRSDDDNNDNNRNDTMYQMIVPIGYRTHGFNFLTSPRLGYARGYYDRTGLDGTNYDGTLEKRIFGLMNEARYPVKFGEWSFEPSVEFNILGYSQKGHEEDKDFSLDIKKQNTYSVESGIGFYLSKDKDLSKDSHLQLTAGFSAYHEFADPYKLELGMHGMDGSFTLHDENRSDNRAVARFGFDYDKDDVSFYGHFTSFIDRELRSSAKTGFKFKF